MPLSSNVFHFNVKEWGSITFVPRVSDPVSRIDAPAAWDLNEFSDVSVRDEPRVISDRRDELDDSLP